MVAYIHIVKIHFETKDPKYMQIVGKQQNTTTTAILAVIHYCDL